MIIKRMINILLVIGFGWGLISIYQNQIQNNEDEIEIINQSTPIIYASGSLINSAKEYLVDHIYVSYESTQLVDKLLSLDAKLLIFLNDELLHIKTVEDDKMFAYYDENLSELIFHYRDEVELLHYFDETFYYLIGEYLHQTMEKHDDQNILDEMYDRVVDSDVNQLQDLITDKMDYVAECVRLFYTNPILLESHPQSHQFITSVLSTFGLK